MPRAKVRQQRRITWLFFANIHCFSSPLGTSSVLRPLLKLWPAERRASDGGMRQGLRLNPVDSEASLDRRPDLPSPAKGNAVTPILSMKDYTHITSDTPSDWHNLQAFKRPELDLSSAGRQGINHKAFLHSPGTATTGSILINYRSLPLILSAVLWSRTDYESDLCPLLYSSSSGNAWLMGPYII